MAARAKTTQVPELVRRSIEKLRDPEAFGRRLARPEDFQYATVLGIDPGTKCGFAVGFVTKEKVTYPDPLHIGLWDLSAGPFESGGMRFLRLRHFLAAARPDLVIFEASPIGTQRVRTATAVDFSMKSQEFLSALRGVITCWCEEFKVACQTVTAAQIKQRGAGKGNANKLEMIRACNREFGTNFPVEEKHGFDDAADAAFACALGLDWYEQGLRNG